MEASAAAEQHKAAMEACFQGCKDLYERVDGWEKSSPHDGVELAALHQGGSRVLRAVGVVPCCCAKKLFEAVFRQTLDEKRRLGNDVLLEDHDIEAYDDWTVLRRQVYKIQWPIANRESVVIRGGRPWGSHRWVQFETSIQHAKYPVQSSPVRVQCHRSCFIYEDTKDGNVLVTYFVDLELGGNIPNWVVSLGDKKAGERIATFRVMAKESNLKAE